MLTPPRAPGASSALLTDHYELTMLASALQDGTAGRPCTFEVFCRSLLGGRRYGMVAGTGRLVEAVTRFRFTDEELEFLERTRVVNPRTLAYLADYSFRGDIDGYAEGELYFPFSPVLTVSGTFGDAVLLETLALSVLNHDSAVATAASRMVTAARGRPIIEMGSRRTHEAAAVAAARAAYVAGFSATSNLEAGLTYGIPTRGTVAHAFVMLHDDEESAFKAQVAALGAGTTLLVDTYDTMTGIHRAVAAAGPALAAVRIDSGDLGAQAAEARELLDSLGATGTRIVATGDLDEYSVARLADTPVDIYGVGTSVVTGSGVPAPGFVYKVVEVDGRPVAKRSPGKASVGGRKIAVRRHDGHGRRAPGLGGPVGRGVASAELVTTADAYETRAGDRLLQIPLMRSGVPVPSVPSLATCRALAQSAREALPEGAHRLSAGDPAIPTIRASPS